jgi:hypothetical protein
VLHWHAPCRTTVTCLTASQPHLPVVHQTEGVTTEQPTGGRTQPLMRHPGPCRPCRPCSRGDMGAERRTPQTLLASAGRAPPDGKRKHCHVTLADGRTYPTIQIQMLPPPQHQARHHFPAPPTATHGPWALHRADARMAMIATRRIRAFPIAFSIQSQIDRVRYGN